ncbi:MAG: SIS domain-containing protein [Candidatus Limnocylindrales bacterium]
MALLDEIREQPEVCARLLERARPIIEGIAAEARRRDLSFVVIAARGSSDHAAVYAQYVLGVLAGLPVALATPSVVTRYGGHPRMANALVLGISQSGRSPDVVEVIAEAQRQGALTMAITNDPGSPLAVAANRSLDLGAGAERAVAATKTYTAEMIAIAMIAAELSTDHVAARRALETIPAALAEALSADPAAREAASRFASMDQCIVLGRGYHLATALEWALKLKELAAVGAQAYSSADYKHGPVASLADGGAVLAVRANGPLATDVTELLERLRTERGAQVLLISDEPAAPSETHLPFPATLPEWLSPIAAIVPGQLFALHLTEARGMDPEAPRGLNKVTLTH